jgi:hypothetical protein
MNNQQAQTQTTSLLIFQNKKRLQNTIDHYHRNLPPTYMETKRVIRDDRKLKDIRDQEIKNTMFVDPLTNKIGIPISTQSGEIEDKKMYIVPDFLTVSHRKKMMDKVFSTYSAYVSKNKKNRDVQAVHTKALEISVNEINEYIKWVERNNDRLVKNYPEMFSYRNNEVDNVPPAQDVPKEAGFVDKIKKIFKGGN